MFSIICPIRGSHESMPTIERAIGHAKEHNQTICFVFVIDLGVLGLTEVLAHKQIVSHEMANLASFVLLAAKIEAKRNGVQAEGVTRFGKLDEEIVALVKEKGASVVIIGQTKPGKEREINSETLTSMIQNQTQAEVILV